MAAKRPKKIRATWDFRGPKSDRKLGPHGFQKSEKCQLTQPRFGPPLKGCSVMYPLSEKVATLKYRKQSINPSKFLP